MVSMTSHYRSAGDAITRMLLPGLLHLTSDRDARAVFLAANGPELLAARLYAWAPDGMPRGPQVPCPGKRGRWELGKESASSFFMHFGQ
jgi:hypothetical protein